MNTTTLPPTQSHAAGAAGGIAQIQPYLFFDGRCDEAIEFYRRVLGAEVTMLMRFKDAPAPGSCAPGSEQKVMHASVRIGATELLASDGRCENRPKFDGFALSVTTQDAATARRVFRDLAEGGQVQMALEKTFFSEAFGMLADKFGVGWMVYVTPSNQTP